MNMKGRQKYVPAFALKELQDIKFVDKIQSDCEAFRKMATNSKLMRVGKRGVFREIIAIMVVLFVLGIILWVQFFVNTRIHDALLSNDVINNSVATRNSVGALTSMNNRLDYVFLMGFIGVALGSFIASWLLAGNIIFLIVDLLMTIIAVVLAPVFSNLWYDVTNASGWGIGSNVLPITNHVLLNLPYYLALIGGINLILFFMKQTDTTGGYV